MTECDMQQKSRSWPRPDWAIVKQICFNSVLGSLKTAALRNTL